MKHFPDLAPVALVALSALHLSAQTPNPAGAVIMPADYDRWNTIANPVLSNDGAWVVYTLTPVIGDGLLMARSTRSTTEHRLARLHRSG